MDAETPIWGEPEEFFMNSLRDRYDTPEKSANPNIGLPSDTDYQDDPIPATTQIDLASEQMTECDLFTSNNDGNMNQSICDALCPTE